MVSVERISFVTSGHDADERLIREYVVPALERLESVSGCRGSDFPDLEWTLAMIRVR
jgi:hypothetical protein